LYFVADTRAGISTSLNYRYDNPRRCSGRLRRLVAAGSILFVCKADGARSTPLSMSLSTSATLGDGRRHREIRSLCHAAAIGSRPDHGARSPREIARCDISSSFCGRAVREGREGGREGRGGGTAARGYKTDRLLNGRGIQCFIGDLRWLNASVDYHCCPVALPIGPSRGKRRAWEE